MKSYEEIRKYIDSLEKDKQLTNATWSKAFLDSKIHALKWVIKNEFPFKEGDVYKTTDGRIGVIVGGTCGYIKMQVLGDVGVYNFRRNDINDKFSDKDWKPVKYLFNIKEHIEQI